MSAERLLWLLPLAVWVAVQRFSPSLLAFAVSAVVATGAVVVVSNHALGALCVLAALFPFQLQLPAVLYRYGVPADILRPAAAWKEIVVIGVLVAGFRHARRSGLDGLDRLILLFLAIVVFYAAVPTLIGAAAPTGLVARAAGIRQVAGFLLLFLGCRHIEIDERTRRRVCGGVLVAAIVLGLGAVAQKIDFTTFARFNNETLGVRQYADQVRGFDTQSRALDFTETGRPGSFAGSANTLAGYLIVPFALGLARLRSSPRPWVALATTASVVGAILSATRGAVVAMAIATVVILWSHHGATSRQRTRLAVLAVVGILVLAPTAVGSGLIGRFADVSKDVNSTEQAHRFGIERGFELMLARPLGLGIGTTTGVGERFGTVSTVNDNQYILVANELGIAAALVFVAITVATLHGLWRRRAAVSALGPSAALAGLAVVGLFAIVYEDLVMSWTLWMLVGFELSTIASATSAEPAQRRAVATQ